MTRTVLVVDDKEILRDSIAMTLTRAGLMVIAAEDGARALELIASRRPDAVISDLKMPGMTGLELVEQVRERDADVPVILMTAFGTIETAVRAMKLGAYDYITKPFEGDELVISVKRAIEHARLKRENQILQLTPSGEPSAAQAGPGGRRGMDRIIGSSGSMRDVKDELHAIARSQGTVLISGESGTGKEVAARAIHEMSSRAGEPFLAVNCAAMSESLLESELFGHEKGAFTGAEALRKGRFELAHGGTLLLDEISEIRPQVQAKLLRVLQERTFERVGSSTPIGIDVRVIATTNRDLEHEVERKRFRQDLFFRLNVLPVRMPSLRERAGDVRELAPYFIDQVCAREGRSAMRVSAEAMALLEGYQWPGNVRELHNLCERAVVLSRGETIEAGLLAGWVSGASAHRAQMTPEVGAAPAVAAAAPSAEVKVRSIGMQAPARPMGAAQEQPKALADIEREVILETLGRFHGHRQKTAQSLGIGVRTLGLKLKRWKELELISEEV